MAAVAELLMGPVAQAIGWALVHFVWQGALLALLLAALLHLPGLRSPRVRYGLAFACLLAMVALPVATGWAVYTPEPAALATPLLETSETEKPVAATPPKAVTANASETAPKPALSSGPAPTPVREFTPAAPPRHEVIAAMLRWERIRAVLAPYVPACVVLWLLGVFIMGWRNVASWFLTQRLRTQGIDRVPDRIEALVAALSAKLGVRGAVACLQSSRIAVPATIGWLKPVVLLPASSLLGLEASQLEAILAHELAHIRRHDYLANLFQTLAETVLFYHPAVWWVSRRMRVERELCCDDMAVQLCASPAVYAGALARVAALQQTPDYAMAASGGSLLARIRRLARPDTPRDTRATRGWVGLAVVLGVVAAVTGPNLTALFAQPSDGPPGARAITFPEWTMGQLMVRPWGSDWQAQWEPHQPAMGTVQIPEGMEVQLVLDNNAVTDLTPLSYLAAEDLQSLDFRRTEIQDTPLAHIEGMELRELNFELTEITNEAIQHFDDMTSLETLSVGRTNVNNEGVVQLGGLTGIQQLSLDLTGVTDEGFAQLDGLRDIRFMSLWNARITDESLPAIGRLTGLRALGLEGTQITDAGLVHLQSLQDLYLLNIQTTAVGDLGIENLGKLPALGELNLRNTRVTDAVIALLQEQFSLSKVDLPMQVSREASARLTGIGGYRAASDSVAEFHVQDVRTGQPVPNAKIEILWHPSPRHNRPRYIWSDESGKIRFYPKFDHGADVTTYAQGYVPRTDAWDPASQQSFLIEIEKASSIGGYVVNESGAPVAGAVVRLDIPGEREYSTDSLQAHAEQTDEQGAWRCDHAPSDLSEFSIELDHEAYITTNYTPEDLSSSRLKNGSERLIIQKGIGVNGEVVDETGAPIPDATVVELVERRHGLYSATPNSTTTSSEGTFQLTNQQAGPIRLKVNAGGYLPLVENVDFQSGAELRFTLSVGHELIGRVVNQSEEPLEGVLVDTSRGLRVGTNDHLNTHWKTATDAGGRFYWDEAPAEPVSLQFQKDGYAHLVKELTATGEEIVVVMSRPLLVTGEIVDGSTGTPIRSARVDIRQGTASSPSAIRDVTRSYPFSIDSDGVYSLELNRVADLSEFTRFQLVVKAPGYVDEKTRWIESDERNPTINLTLTPQAPVTGVVVDPDGAPAVGALYAVATVSDAIQIKDGTLDEGDKRRVQAVDDQGRFSIFRQNEPYLLMVTHEKGIARVPGDSLEEGAQVVLDPWARIEGTIKIGPNPAANETVTLSVNPVHHLDKPNYLLFNTTQSGPDGNFIFERVGAGEAQLSRGLAPREGHRPQAITRPLYITAGESRTVDLGGSGRPVIGALSGVQALEAQSVKLSSTTGSVYRKIDVPWPDESKDWSAEQRRTWSATWSKTDEGAEILGGAYRHNFYLNEDGTFRIEDLIPGSYHLRIELNAFEEGKRRWELPTIATVSHEFDVPEMEGGRANDPLDLGTLDVTFPEEE